MYRALPVLEGASQYFRWLGSLTCHIRSNNRKKDYTFDYDFWRQKSGHLTHPINYTLSGARDRLVSFRQKLCQNRKVLHWI